MAADEDYEKIIRSRLKDENGQPYSESTLLRVGDVCQFLAEYPDVTLILKPVAEAEEEADTGKSGRAEEGSQQLSDGVTRLCETFADSVGESRESPERDMYGIRRIWNTTRRRNASAVKIFSSNRI